MAPEALAHVLRPLSNLFNSNDYPNLLIGLGLADDAAIYRLSDREALVATLDFFTPIVDDPYAYGAIAAANAMGDVYAMGGRVLFALNVAAFPGDLPYDIIGQVLKGGADKVREAGAAIAGGHTIQDKEPKYGLVVLGMVDPNHILTKGGAQAGDQLVLTKPLGTGVITTAFMRDLTSEEQLAAATVSMLQLNRAASEAAVAAGVRAATDITGFGLLGHASEMVQATAKTDAYSSIAHPSPSTDDRSPILVACQPRSPIADHRATAFRFHFNRLPWLPGAREFGREWVYPGGAHNNRQHFGPLVRFEEGIPEDQQVLCFSPETSGGLLLAVRPDRVDQVLGQVQPAWVVGEVVAADTPHIEVLIDRNRTRR